MDNTYSGLDANGRVVMWDGDSYRYVNKEDVVSSLMNGWDFDSSKDTNVNVSIDRTEEFLITGIKYSFGLLVIGQTVMGIMSLV